MNAAIVVKFGTPKAGREALGLQVLGESMALWERLASEGRCEPAEIYLFNSGGGMTVIKGEESQLLQLLVDEEITANRIRAMAIVDDVTMEVATTGDGIQQRVDLYGKEMSNLGLM